MPFVSGNTMLQHAWKNQYGIGAFSAHNAETIQGILAAGEAEQSPIMIQVGQKVIQYMGLTEMVRMIELFARDVTIPVAIHLDHSRDFKQVLRGIQIGMQSVMFDGSALPIEENISITKKVVEIATSLGIGAEGEIGKIGGTEDDITVDEKDAMITTKEEAIAFAEATNVPYLAVSIGTAHGMFKKAPQLHFERMQEISQATGRPIVLHGGSGVPGDQVKRAISLGIAKINVDTELRQAFSLGVQEVFERDPEEYHLAVSLAAGREKMKRVVQDKIQLFGSKGKAKALLDEMK